MYKLILIISQHYNCVFINLYYHAVDNLNIYNLLIKIRKLSSYREKG